MQDTVLVEKMIRLAAKVGLFFACVDGEYSDAERQYIESFVSQLSALAPDDDASRYLGDPLSEDLTTEQLIADTKEILDDFNAFERPIACRAIIALATDVVNADGTEKPKEREALKQFVAALSE